MTVHHQHVNLKLMRAKNKPLLLLQLIEEYFFDLRSLSAACTSCLEVVIMKDKCYEPVEV